MKFSILGVSLAMALSAGLAAAAQADQVAAQPSATAATTAQESFSAYKANTNPAVTVGTTGPYDQEDLYVGRHGFPLEGWSQVGEGTN